MSGLAPGDLTMPFAVEAYLDPRTDARVRALWEALPEYGITSVMPSIGARPHVSLATFQVIERRVLEPLLAEFARSTEPVPIVLGSVGSWPTAEGVVFLGPVVTPELRALHEAFHGHVERLGLRSHEYYRPGAWVPHCTIAFHLGPDEIGRTIEIALQENVFGPASLVELGLVQVPPARELCSHPLGA